MTLTYDLEAKPVFSQLFYAISLCLQVNNSLY